MDVENTHMPLSEESRNLGDRSRVLVVEDEIMTSRMVQVILEQNGFTVSCVFSVKEAMEELHLQKPELILMDVELPDGNGFEVCEYLQKEQGLSRIPVLFMSSHEEVDTKIRGFEVGGVDYITKPVAGAELIARVRTHLRLRRAYESLAELQAERVQRLAGAQESMMPNPEDLPEARFAIHLGQVLDAGGDFYDVVPVGEGIVDYIVADASGHDLAASFWTATLKTMVSQNARPENRPRDIVHSINNVLRRILPEGVFFTLIYVRVNRKKNRVILVNAAHPPAVVIPADGSSPWTLDQSGDIVGMFEDAIYASQELELQTGDRLLLYSDGLIELTGHHEEGMKKLLQNVSSVATVPLPKMVTSLVRQVCGDMVPNDDIVLMGVEL